MGYKNLKIGKNETRNEHRVIMERVIGRRLSWDEVVHHINGIKDDNRIENLKIMDRKDHARMHFRDCIPLSSLKKCGIKLRLPHTEDCFTCVGCRKMKFKGEFYKHKNHWNGLNRYCKECTKSMQKGIKEPTI